MNTDEFNQLLDQLIAAPDNRLNPLSLARVAEVTQHPIASLQAHASDDEALAIAIHLRHLETIVKKVTALIEGMPAGRLRLQLAVEQFWDICLERLAYRRLMLNTRRNPDISAELDRRNRNFVHLVSAELAAMGAPDSNAMAPLVRAMMESVAAAELKVGTRLPAQRAAVWQLLDHNWGHPLQELRANQRPLLTGTA